eukprot:5224677-Pyramimonas_sp.AAC.1
MGAVDAREHARKKFDPFAAGCPRLSFHNQTVQSSRRNRKRRSRGPLSRRPWRSPSSWGSAPPRRPAFYFLNQLVARPHWALM